MKIIHDQHVHHKWQVFVIFIFFVLLRASFVYIQCQFIPSAVWKCSDNISSNFGCRKLASNRKKLLSFRCTHRCHLLFGQEYGGLVMSVVFPYVCQYVHASVHLSVCSYVCMSIYYVHSMFPINPYIPVISGNHAYFLKLSLVVAEGVKKVYLSGWKF